VTEGEDHGNPQYDAVSGDAGGTTQNAEERVRASDCTKCTKPVPETAATQGEALLENTTASELLLVIRRALAALDAGDGEGARAVLAAALRSREPGEADGGG
jgi:hypothetical protein